MHLQTNICFVLLLHLLVCCTRLILGYNGKSANYVLCVFQILQCGSPNDAEVGVCKSLVQVLVESLGKKAVSKDGDILSALYAFVKILLMCTTRLKQGK